MANLEVSLAVAPSVLTAPLLSGEVIPEGITAHFQEADVEENSRRLAKAEFDVGEVTIAAFVRAFEEGTPFFALPLFTSGRRFVHDGIWFSTLTRIALVGDMRGRIVVTRRYWLPSSVWQRKILGMIYQVQPEDMSWVTLEPEYPGEPVPSHLLHRLETVGRSPEELAHFGMAGVCLTAGESPQPAGRAAPVFVPAFPNLDEAVRGYYQQTKVFPILHVTVIREQLVREQPWVVGSLCDAYAEAKKMARSREQPSSLAESQAGETTAWMYDLMGDDPWPYGISANVKALLGFVSAARIQGLIHHHLQIEDLFARGLPDSMK